MTDVPHDAPLVAALPALTCLFGLGDERGRRFLTDGLMNRNWRLDTSTGRYAVKQITDVPLAKVRRNLDVLPGLAREELPVPTALTADGGQHVVEIGGDGFCVLPWVEGAHVQGSDLTPDRAHRLGTLLARLHRSLARHGPAQVPHRGPTSKVTNPAIAAIAADALCEKFPAEAAEVFDKEVVEALHERKILLEDHAARRPATEHPAGPYGWTHGDFQYRNLLWQGSDVVAILDWDRLAVRPYAEEVARTAQVQFGVDGCFSLERIAAFVSGYRSVIALSAEDLADAVSRLWWKRMTDFWQLEFYLDRQEPAFGELFLTDEALLHWWTDHLDEVQAAFSAR